MTNRFGFWALAAAAALLAACGGGYGSGMMPHGAGIAPQGAAAQAVPENLPAFTIGFDLPGKRGTVKTKWGTIGGYTQMKYSQIVAFPPGTKVTLRNLSKSIPHTLNVLGTKRFPASPNLGLSASGTNVLALGYRSGSIRPGGRVSIVLKNPGRYFIGCAYHYPESPHMRGIIIVRAGVKPGPQATPVPAATSAPSSSPSSNPSTEPSYPGY